MTKKYIITAKETDEIIALVKQLGVIRENGYWHSVLADIAFPNTTHYAYDASGQVAEAAFPTDGDPVFPEIGEAVEIPTEIDGERVKIKPGEWCYTAEDGFFKNPDWEG